jgi:hypothetical protein
MTFEFLTLIGIGFLAQLVRTARGLQFMSEQCPMRPAMRSSYTRERLVLNPAGRGRAQSELNEPRPAVLRLRVRREHKYLRVSGFIPPQKK